jgi:hypothetical protein
MLYREIIAVCSEIHTKHRNTLCGQNLEFVNDKPGGTYSNHWALEDYISSLTFPQTINSKTFLTTKIKCVRVTSVTAERTTNLSH